MHTGVGFNLACLFYYSGDCGSTGTIPLTMNTIVKREKRRFVVSRYKIMLRIVCVLTSDKFAYYIGLKYQILQNNIGKSDSILAN